MNRQVTELLLMQNRHGKKFAHLIKYSDGTHALLYMVGMKQNLVSISREVYKELAELGTVEYGGKI